jgi:hypothetical protein
MHLPFSITFRSSSSECGNTNVSECNGGVLLENGPEIKGLFSKLCTFCTNVPFVLGRNLELNKKARSLKASKDMSINLVCPYHSLSNEPYILTMGGLDLSISLNQLI